MEEHTFKIRTGDYKTTIIADDPFKGLVKLWKKSPPKCPLGLLVEMERDTPDETGEKVWYAATTTVLSKAGYDVSDITAEMGKLLEEKHKQKVVVN